MLRWLGGALLVVTVRGEGLRTTLSVRGGEDQDAAVLNGIGYWFYGPREGYLNKSAVFLPGFLLCNPPTVGLADLIVVSDGIGCGVHGVDLYDRLNDLENAPAALVFALPFSCPRSHMFARGLHGVSTDGKMMFISVGRKESVIETNEPVGDFLPRVLPTWNDYQDGAKAGRIEITAYDPAVRADLGWTKERGDP